MCECHKLVVFGVCGLYDVWVSKACSVCMGVEGL